MEGSRTLREARSDLPHDAVERAATEIEFLVATVPETYTARRNDPELAPFIELVSSQETFAMSLWRALGQGRIRNTLIHGDTKLENFLFCSSTGKVKSLVDLDTIMPFTWLADWGETCRSMISSVGEKERDLSIVDVDREVYESIARGFLTTSRSVTERETKLMPTAVQTVTLELGMRFLTDYMRGDTYFQLGPSDSEDLNRVRAMNQITLYRRLVEFGPEAERIIKRIQMSLL